MIPHKPHGAPGTAILDYDGDGDLDIYVTNSIGGANSLFSSQLHETGELRFLDVAPLAGVAAVDHDSSGVCFGDIDNDGDHDLLVLGAIMPNRLYENRGDGTFVDITASAGVGGGDLSTSACSMGDVDGDGLLDIAIANTHTSWNDLFGIGIPFQFNEHNQLFLNQGGNVFTDESAARGFETLDGVPMSGGSGALTWAIALVDYDLDGDVDAFTFDDQGGVPSIFMGGFNYGIIHLHENDGTGHFTDRTVEAGLDKDGNWMGVEFGDFDCDGKLDFFASNVGDHPGGGGPRLFPVGYKSSRWFLNNGDGTFDDPGVGDLGATPFGWGVAVADYDNDGDGDILYHGAIDLGTFVDASNPGVILRNEGCSASFTFDRALVDSSPYDRLVGQGLASGDLNADGFVDLVTISNSRIPDSVQLVQENELAGGVFDDEAFFMSRFFPSPDEPGLFLWTGNAVENGRMTVEISSGDNGNRSASVTLRGSAGTISGGAANRDGIGAVITFTPRGGHSQMTPVAGGSSYASQHALTKVFGMGKRKRGTIEVLWPGGVRNRLLNVRPGEHIVFPEIPCSEDLKAVEPTVYVACVRQALDGLLEAGVIDRVQRRRFFSSAIACDPSFDATCLGFGAF